MGIVFVVAHRVDLQHQMIQTTGRPEVGRVRLPVRWPITDRRVEHGVGAERPPRRRHQPIDAGNRPTTNHLARRERILHHLEGPDVTRAMQSNGLVRRGVVQQHGDTRRCIGPMMGSVPQVAVEEDRLAVGHLDGRGRSVRVGFAGPPQRVIARRRTRGCGCVGGFGRTLLRAEAVAVTAGDDLQ